MLVPVLTMGGRHGFDGIALRQRGTAGVWTPVIAHKTISAEPQFALACLDESSSRSLRLRLRACTDRRTVGWSSLLCLSGSDRRLIRLVVAASSPVLSVDDETKMNAGKA